MSVSVAAVLVARPGISGAAAVSRSSENFRWLASQRKFTEDLLTAAAPLMPGRAESTAAAETDKPG